MRKVKSIEQHATSLGWAIEPYNYRIIYDRTQGEREHVVEIAITYLSHVFAYITKSRRKADGTLSTRSRRDKILEILECGVFTHNAATWDGKTLTIDLDKVDRNQIQRIELLNNICGTITEFDPLLLHVTKRRHPSGKPAYINGEKLSYVDLLALSDVVKNGLYIARLESSQRLPDNIKASTEDVNPVGSHIDCYLPRFAAYMLPDFNVENHAKHPKYLFSAGSLSRVVNRLITDRYAELELLLKQYMNYRYSDEETLLEHTPLFRRGTELYAVLSYFDQRMERGLPVMRGREVLEDEEQIETELYNLYAVFQKLYPDAPDTEVLNGDFYIWRTWTEVGVVRRWFDKHFKVINNNKKERLLEELNKVPLDDNGCITEEWRKWVVGTTKVKLINYINSEQSNKEKV